MSEIPAFDRVRMARALRKERERAGLSLSEAAQRAGLGKSTLSTLENGSGNPSVETLWALAGTYGVPLSLLIDAPTPQVTIVRREELAMLRSAEGSYAVALVSSCPPGRRRDLYIVTAEPGDIKLSAPHPPGVIEHILVTAGRVTVTVGEQRVELGVGDYLRHRGDVPHSFEALEPGSAAIDIIES